MLLVIVIVIVIVVLVVVIIVIVTIVLIVVMLRLIVIIVIAIIVIQLLLMIMTMMTIIRAADLAREESLQNIADCCFGVETKSQRVCETLRSFEVEIKQTESLQHIEVFYLNAEIRFRFLISTLK